jgi:hypothetical protein
MRFRSDEPEALALLEATDADSRPVESDRLRLRIVPVAPRPRPEELPWLDLVVPPARRREPRRGVH